MKRKPEKKPDHHQVVEEIKDRKKPGYRPSVLHATTEEAKDILRKRYADRGFAVEKITRYDGAWMTVSFKGKGPMGATEGIFVNWPYLEGAPTAEAAQKILDDRAREFRKSLQKKGKK